MKRNLENKNNMSESRMITQEAPSVCENICRQSTKEEAEIICSMKYQCAGYHNITN
jgi:hypothetical protein